MFCPDTCSWPKNCPCFTPKTPPTQEELDAINADYILLETFLNTEEGK
jgi:hypothetical protein